MRGDVHTRARYAFCTLQLCWAKLVSATRGREWDIRYVCAWFIRFICEFQIPDVIESVRVKLNPSSAARHTDSLFHTVRHACAMTGRYLDMRYSPCRNSPGHFEHKVVHVLFTNVDGRHLNMWWIATLLCSWLYCDMCEFIRSRSCTICCMYV